MMNVTTRIAIAVTNLPPFEFNWGDLAPQKPRSCLTVDDLMPSSADGKELFDRACKYVSMFLVEQFDSLKDLQKFLPHNTATGRTNKSVVVPMKMLETKNTQMRPSKFSKITAPNAVSKERHS